MYLCGVVLEKNRGKHQSPKVHNYKSHTRRHCDISHGGGWGGGEAEGEVRGPASSRRGDSGRGGGGGGFRGRGGQRPVSTMSSPLWPRPADTSLHHDRSSPTVHLCAGRWPPDPRWPPLIPPLAYLPSLTYTPWPPHNSIPLHTITHNLHIMFF